MLFQLEKNPEIPHLQEKPREKQHDKNFRIFPPPLIIIKHEKCLNTNSFP